MSGLEFSVEIDNSRFVPLLSLESRGSGRLPLTTIAPRQRRAIVNLAVVRNGKPTTVRRFEVAGEQLGGRNHPRIDVEAHHDGGGRIQLKLFIENRLYTSTILDVSPHMSGRRVLPWLIGSAALVALVVALLLFIPQRLPIRSTDGGDQGEVPPRTAGRESEPASPTPTPAQAQQADEGAAEQDAASRPKRDTEDAAESAGGGGGSNGPVSAEAADDTPSPAFGGPADEVTPPRAGDPVVIYFLPDSSRILPEAGQRIERLYGVLRRYPDHRLVIEGHCAIAGSEAGRAEISENRARNVRLLLEELGWDFGDDSRVLGLGATAPVTTDMELQYLNRRVELWALPPGGETE